MFNITYRLSGQPLWLSNSDINGIWILIGIGASALHILAPGAYKGQTGMIPRRNRIAMGLGIGSATAVSLALLSLRPDLAPYIEVFRPYLEDWFRTNRSALHLWGSVA